MTTQRVHSIFTSLPNQETNNGKEFLYRPLLMVFILMVSITNIKMPGLVRKIAIYPTANGLVLHPVAQRTHRNVPCLQIQYSTNEIISLPSSSPSPPLLSALLNVHGIVGTRPVSAICKKNMLRKPLKGF